MISIDQAIQTILESTDTVLDSKQTEHVDLYSALHRVVAQNIVSPINVPPASNSAMDGYALHSDDINSTPSQPLSVSQRIPAGQSPLPLESGTVVRLFTGSEIPQGANAVVMQENCSLQDDGKVVIESAVTAGQHIRQAGQDIAINTSLFQPGHLLTAPDIGVIASVGINKLSVYRKLRIGFFTSGDELVEPGEGLGPAQIYNSNKYLLHALIRSVHCEPVDLGHIPDTASATEHALQTIPPEVDIILTTGGVSVGEEDHIKQAVEKLGELNLWKIAIKPGKPLAFGKLGDTVFFGLPGNPVSTLVTFLLCVRPCAQKMMGAIPQPTPKLLFPANFSLEGNKTRQEYLRVRMSDNQLNLFNNQSSGVLSSASWANALAVIPSNTTIKPGDQVETIPFSVLGI